MLDTKNPLAPITVGAGFIITVNPANVLNNGAPVNVPSTIVSLTPSAVNFVHITSGGVVSVNISGFPSGCIPIAQVTCSSTSVTGIVDSRPDFYIIPAGGSTPNTMFFPWGGMLGVATANNLSAPNKIQVSGFYLPNPLSVSNITVGVSASDAGNNYDWGIYDSTGALKANVGAHSVALTGVVDLAVLGAPISLSAGKYYFAFTGAAATASLNAAASAATTKELTFRPTVEVATSSSGGVLPASIAVPVDLWSANPGNVHGFATH